MTRISLPDSESSRLSTVVLAFAVVAVLFSLTPPVTCLASDDDKTGISDDTPAGQAETSPAPPGSNKLEITAVRIGFDYRFKLGCWTPVEVTLTGGDASQTGVVQIESEDGDGVPVRFSTEPMPLGPTPSGDSSTPSTWSATLMVKFGRPDRGVTVRVVSDKQTLATRSFGSAMPPAADQVPIAMPATDKLFLTLGDSIGLAEVVRPTSRDERQLTLVAQLDDDHQLPTKWYGYDGVDTIVFSTSDTSAYRRLSAGGDRFAALRLWVELGGRLIWFVGQRAPQVLADDSPLAELAPGRFDEMTVLRQTTAVEEYSGSKHPINFARGAPPLQVPKIVDLAAGGPQTNLEVDGGRGAEQLPLVIRRPFGFGEIVFVAIDLDQPPLATWRGRRNLVRRLLDRPQVRTTEGSPSVYSQGYQDLSGQLRASLDQFPTIRVLPFALVMLFSAVYILVIGPGDYILLRRMRGRLEWTWLTFPVVVVLFSGVAYYLATSSKGDSRHLYQIDLVDVDLTTGRHRGTAWCNVFSPRAETFDLTFLPKHVAARSPDTLTPDAESPVEFSTLLSWMGVPGRALGSMQSAADQPVFSPPYEFSPDDNQLSGVPIPQWAAKSFVARWIDRMEPRLAVDLSREADSMLSGTLRNDTRYDLTNCVLCYDRWSYKIPALRPGQEIKLDGSLRAVTLQLGLASKVYDRTSLDADYILRTIMFYQAIGGRRYAALGNDYLSTYDLSRQLRLGRAILVGQVKETDGTAGAGGLLYDEGKRIAVAGDPRTTIYRFVLPVQPSSESLTQANTAASNRD